MVRRKPRRGWRILAGLLLLTAILGGGFRLWLGASLPQVEGRLPLPGLKASVTVLRDDAGIPTVMAGNELDAVRALGFVHAQERLFQMDMTRRYAEGRLAEVVGPAALDTDRMMRLLGFACSAEAAAQTQTPEFAAVLDAYAAGVNAYLSAQKVLPPEFAALDYRPEPWRPADSLALGKLLAFQLSGNFEMELLRARLLQTLPSAELQHLLPAYPATAPVALEPTRAALRDLPLDRLIAVLPYPAEPQRASNDWVVDGAHSITGKPLLANDPHLDFTLPGIWYLARLEAPGLHVEGGTMAGLPVVVLGHNDRIAWGYTTTGADVEDLFVERVDAKDPNRYATPAGTEPFAVWTETILVKGAAPVVVSLRETRHGPVLSDLDPAAQRVAGSDHVLALQTSFLGMGPDRSVEAQWRIDHARDWASWQEALKLLTAPVQNMVYADVDGHIGFMAPGLIPLRKSGDGSLPQPGWTGAADWTGWIPFDELPRSFDPPSGHIVTANNKIVPDSYPYTITRDWGAPWRAQRIETKLAAAAKQSLDSMAAIQRDRISLPARQLLPLLLQARVADARGKAVLVLLGKWNGAMAADRPEPLIYAAWKAALERALYADRLGDLFPGFYAPPPETTLAVLRDGLAGKQESWCAPDCAGLLGDSLRLALDDLARRYGDKVEDWRWGTAHAARFDHPIFRRVPVLAGLFDRSVPADGGPDTVDAGAYRDTDTEAPFADRHGPGLRAIYDLADLTRSQFLMAPGQSGHILSRHYDDLLQGWRDFDWLRPARAASVETLTLEPR